jgi:hypothetical protein
VWPRSKYHGRCPRNKAFMARVPLFSRGIARFHLGHDRARFAASCMFPLVTTLHPEHHVIGASRQTMAHSKFSDSCGDRFSWVCSGGVWEERRILGPEARILHSPLSANPSFRPPPYQGIKKDRYLTQRTDTRTTGKSALTTRKIARSWPRSPWRSGKRGPRRAIRDGCAGGTKCHASPPIT